MNTEIKRVVAAIVRPAQGAALALCVAMGGFPSTGLAAPSESSNFTMPLPAQCTSSQLPRVSLCSPLPGQTLNCVDRALDYCTQMNKIKHKAWTVGFSPDGSDCNTGGPAMLAMLKGMGCAPVVNGEAKIDGGCIDRLKLLDGHALVIVRVLDERKKGNGAAEFVLIEPLLQMAVARWESYEPETWDPAMPDRVVAEVRALYFPIFEQYKVPLKVSYGNPCSIDRHPHTQLSVKDKTIVW